MEALHIIMKATGLSTEELTDLMLDNAQEWLMSITNNNEEVVRQIQKSPLFWKWWRHCWAMRDKEYCELLINQCNFNNATKFKIAKLQADARWIYLHDHCVDTLINKGLRPHKILFNEILKHQKEVCNG